MVDGADDAASRKSTERRLEAFAQIVNHAILFGRLRVARLFRRRLGSLRLVRLTLRPPHGRLELVMRLDERVHFRLQRRDLCALLVGGRAQIARLGGFEMCAPLRVLGERVRGGEFGALPFGFIRTTQ